MEIYHDILIGIERESKARGTVKRTRVQQYSNLSYDKFSRHLDNMAERGLITLKPLSITAKGREFVREYDKIRLFMREIGARFLASETPARRIALELVQDIPSMSHSALLFEDRDQAEMVAADYLAGGLEKGESCVYLTSEDPVLVEERLTRLTRIFEKGVQENRVRIYDGQVRSAERAPSFGEMKKWVDDATRGLKPPYRVFGNLCRPPALPKGLQLRLSREKLLHDRFGELGITHMCWHELPRVPRNLRREFVESMVKHHNYLVYASDPSKAFSFDTSLLRFEP